MVGRSTGVAEKEGVKIINIRVYSTTFALRITELFIPVGDEELCNA